MDDFEKKLEEYRKILREETIMRREQKQQWANEGKELNKKKLRKDGEFTEEEIKINEESRVSKIAYQKLYDAGIESAYRHVYDGNYGTQIKFIE